MLLGTLLASLSTRYAAHLIDKMERDGIVGSADGSRPREILKPPDWLSEVESTLR
ncbi:MAG TPA: DNA translocase FtsK [Acidisarcina sp.]